MRLFQSSDIEIREMLEELKKNPPSPPPPRPEPSWYEGGVIEAGKGAMQAPLDIISHLSPFEYTPDPLKKNTFALNPEKTGVAGHITHSLGHGLSSFLVGGRAMTMAATALRLGAAVSLGPLSLPMFVAGGGIAVALALGRRVYEDQRDEGVDAETATKIGMVSGAIVGIGATINPFGSTALRSALSGAGINLVVSTPDKWATKQLLESNGYKHLSDNIEMFDKTSLAIDTLLGAFFGRLHFKHKGKNIDINPKPSEVDSAMGAKMDIHAMHDLNAGIQMTNEASEIHYRSFEKAQEAFLKGEDFTMNPQDAEKLTQDTLFHPSEPSPPAFEERIKTFEQKIQALEDFSSQDSPSSSLFRKDLDLVKNKIYETALSCFYEHGGK